MNKIKCECGHVNPEGTVLCEACGKPIEGNQHITGNHKKKLLDMRYDGSARRSQTYNRSMIDKIWSFFSSVKVGIWLIVITLVASSIGTIFPQEEYIPEDAPFRDPSIFYEDRYGIFGKIYYQLGFHHLYSSWWYILLIALIGISLVICSLDRVIPLYKALKKQSPKRHKTFVERQRLFSETDHVTEQDKETLVKHLKQQRYKISEKDGHILAEKGRFSRWGPYVNHIGLIIILLAAILRFTPFMYSDASVSIREGETVSIPSTDGQYYIKNKKFTLEEYDEEDERFKASIEKSGNVAKNFQTDVIVYKAKGEAVPGSDPELEKYKEDKIQMNNPLKFDGITLYQRFYDLDEFKDMSFKLYEKDDKDQEAIGTFKVNLEDPKFEYSLPDGYKVKIDDYYPDYYFDEDDQTPQPRSDSTYPKNPAFIFKVYAPGEKEPEVSFAGIGKNIAASKDNQYKLGIVDFSTRDISTLTVRRDYTLPYFIIGAAIFMIGVIQGMYWYHRRVWIHPTEDGLLIAGHTNKNWHGLERDIEKAITDTSINMVEDQQEQE
ncbi:MAG TPA: cytochrome c biogenesis protein ResB [Candidatus Avamphibacillus intestinigallinarum]|nr:cytochrome c biogenesis protein ResB [Candidatus Avamphibacillus intestinigallinarum]